MKNGGFFGKIPHERDFIIHHLKPRMVEIWSAHAAEWMLQAKNNDPAHWERHCLTSSVWRFVLPDGFPDQGVTIAAGLMAGSMDGVGRIFPFSVFLLSDLSFEGVPRFDALDEIMDHIEPVMLAFIEGDADVATLAAVVEKNNAQFLALCQRSTKLPFILHDNEEAVLICASNPIWSTSAASHVYCLGLNASSPCRETFWWREEITHKAQSQCLVARGMPRAAAAQPLFSSALSALWSLRRSEPEQMK